MKFIATLVVCFSKQICFVYFIISIIIIKINSSKLSTVLDKLGRYVVHWLCEFFFIFCPCCIADGCFGEGWGGILIRIAFPMNTRLELFITNQIK